MAAPRTRRVASDRLRMETTRRYELRRATGFWGVPPPISLGLPDGKLTDHEDKLTGMLTEILEGAAPATWCAATWRGDGHPDHEAVGARPPPACARTGAVLLEYPVWMWHWALPADPAVPWDRPTRYRRPVGAPNASGVPRNAIEVNSSSAEVDSAPILPSFVLPRLLAVGEVVFR